MFLNLEPGAQSKLAHALILCYALKLQGVFSNANNLNFFLMIFNMHEPPLHATVVLVQY